VKRTARDYAIALPPLPGGAHVLIRLGGAVYAIYESGQLWRVMAGRFVLQELDRGGYLTYQGWKVHRLVLSAFVRPPRAGEVARHLNGRRTDNRLVNLRWGNEQTNWVDRKRHAAARAGGVSRDGV
jgi:hypothetical protein